MRRISVRTNWPESVPVLTKDDMCHGSATIGQCHCLIGWAWEVFGFGTSECLIVEREMRNHTGGLPVVMFNDESVMVSVGPYATVRRFLNSKQKLANVWNRTMKALGYTEFTHAT